MSCSMSVLFFFMLLSLSLSLSRFSIDCARSLIDNYISAEILIFSQPLAELCEFSCAVLGDRSPCCSADGKDTCPKNEFCGGTEMLCGRTCEPSCANPTPAKTDLNCSSTSYRTRRRCYPFQGACRCSQGFVRRASDNACVKVTEC